MYGFAKRVFEHGGPGAQQTHPFQLYKLKFGTLNFIQYNCPILAFHFGRKINNIELIAKVGTAFGGPAMSAQYNPISSKTRRPPGTTPARGTFGAHGLTAISHCTFPGSFFFQPEMRPHRAKLPLAACPGHRLSHNPPPTQHRARQRPMLRKLWGYWLQWEHQVVYALLQPS